MDQLALTKWTVTATMADGKLCLRLEDTGGEALGALQELVADGATSVEVTPPGLNREPVTRWHKGRAPWGVVAA